jgi:thymidylate kinase
MFVVIEGGDACGKHTLAQSLSMHYDSKGFSVHAYSFPQYLTPLGMEIMRWLSTGRAAEEPVAFQSMMTVDRYSVAHEIKRLAADTNRLVISDRWWQSGYVYGQAVGLDLAFLEGIHISLPVPHLNILLNLSAEEAGKRRPEKRDVYEKNAGLMERVSDGYRELWKEKHSLWRTRENENGGPSRWRILDASFPKEVVFKEACSMIEECWGTR